MGQNSRKVFLMTYSSEKETLHMIKTTENYKNNEYMLMNLESIENFGPESCNEQINSFIEDSQKWMFIIQIDHHSNLDRFMQLKVKIDSVSNIIGTNSHKTFCIILHYHTEDIYI